MVLALYLAGLLAVTLLPLPETAYQMASTQGFDKVVHTGLFGGFAALLYWTLLPSGPPGLRRVVLPSAALAALVELIQAPLAYRTADVWDFFWGMVGSLAAYLLAQVVLRPERGPARD